MDFLLGPWNAFIVHPLMALLRGIANPLQEYFAPGVAGGLAIILFTVGIRTALLPLSLAQVRSSKAMMRLQPQLKDLQRRFKGDREGLARAQMELYRQNGVNPAAGCLPLFMQMPILFGMYWAMLHLSTLGLTLDQVARRDIEPGRVVYEARRADEPYPTNQFVLATLRVVPRTAGPIVLGVPQDEARVSHAGRDLLAVTQGLTITTGQGTPNANWPGTPNGRASVLLRPGGELLPDGTLNRGLAAEVGRPYLVEVEIYAPQTRVDASSVVVTFDPAQVEVSAVETPALQDLPFKSGFLGLPSLGEPDLIYVFGFGIPGVLLLLMTATSFFTTRMTSMPTEDPQQQMMMRYMTFMPLMYLFFFLTTPAGLVLYWLVSNLYTMAQQYFTTGLGLLGGDLKRLTGRDFQPPWAHFAVAAAAANGRASAGPSDSDVELEDRRATAGVLRRKTTTTPAADTRPGATARRAASRGRKRGKR